MKTHSVKTLQLKQFAAYLKARPKDAHKGLFGHVLIVGGDYGFSGAVRMASEAAYRVGAGLVSVATHPEHAFVLNAACPEIMCHGITKSSQLTPLLTKATVIVVGPGMGQSPWSKQCLSAVLKTKKPLVVDADALNLLAKKPQKKSHWILTPHVGEAARLLGKSNAAIEADRITSVKALQKQFGGVAILKGAGSLVCDQDQALMICHAGNPGMATAGMGDILSGVIGGLLAQGLQQKVAAALGVLLHATAGDLAAKQGERGMMATDLLPHLRTLVNRK